MRFSKINTINLNINFNHVLIFEKCLIYIKKLLSAQMANEKKIDEVLALGMIFFK